MKQETPAWLLIILAFVGLTGWGIAIAIMAKGITATFGTHEIVSAQHVTRSDKGKALTLSSAVEVAYDDSDAPCVWLSTESKNKTVTRVTLDRECLRSQHPDVEIVIDE